jgi:ABC-type antimicrobial peptide transport system permease subunit
MRPAWRLAITSAWRRRARTSLLTAAVALSAALIAAVACALSSANNAVNARMDATFGAAQLRLEPAGRGGMMPASALDAVRAWPEVDAAAPRLSRDLALQISRTVYTPRDDDPEGRYYKRQATFRVNAMGIGIDPRAEARLRPIRIVAGRAPEAPGEIVIDATLAGRLTWQGSLEQVRKIGVFDRADPLIARDGQAPVAPAPATAPTNEAEAEASNDLQGVRLGDTVTVRRLFGTSELTVVGMSEPPPLGGRPQAFLTLDGLREAVGREGDDELTQVDITVKPGFDPETVVLARQGDVPEGAILQTAERITSGLDRNMQSGQFGLALAIMLALLSAAFIIVTGLGAGVVERQRELGMLRCIGASRGQIAQAQLVEGLLIGVVGACIGVPLGVGVAAAGAWYYREVLPSGLATPPAMLALAFFGSIFAGLLGAAWPALRASRTSPMGALASRAKAPRARTMVILAVVGLALLAVQAVAVGVPDDGQVVFWSYATFGLPAMFVGYFLLGPPVLLLASTLLAGPLSTLLRLPAKVVQRSVRSMPYRLGFTAGALMTGLALMISNWITGGAMLRDWLGQIDFPDAFVSGLRLSEESRQTLDALPFVERTCAVTLFPVETDAFGIRALQTYQTTFVAFEPEPFFEMTRLVWVQGDGDYARRRLSEGGAVIVAREFNVAQGLGVGDTFTCRVQGESHDFEVVGVIASPGLEVVGQYFNAGEDLARQAVHAVFGTRRDLIDRFGVDAIHLIQIDLDENVNDEVAVAEIRDALFGSGVLDAGSGRQIKREIESVAGTTLAVFSAVAVMAMLVACFGVANLVVAGIHARRYELGVLRAIGASRGVVARLILAEAFLIAIGAIVLGTALGFQAAWAGQRMYALLAGLTLSLRPPIGPLLFSWAVTLVLTLLAAAPAVIALARRKPLDLLGARGG